MSPIAIELDQKFKSENVVRGERNSAFLADLELLGDRVRRVGDRHRHFGTGTERASHAADVDDQVVAPAVEGAAVRVGEPVGDVAVEFPRERLVAEDGSVDIAHGAFDSLDLRAVENSVTEQQRAARLVDHRVRLVVGVG